MDLEKLYASMGKMGKDAERKEGNLRVLIATQSMNVESSLQLPGTDAKLMYLGYLNTLNVFYRVVSDEEAALVKLRLKVNKCNVDNPLLKRKIIMCLGNIVFYPQNSQSRLEMEIARVEVALSELIPKLEIPGLG